jgi:hypothetical protein
MESRAERKRREQDERNSASGEHRSRMRNVDDRNTDSDPGTQDDDVEE